MANQIESPGPLLQVENLQKRYRRVFGHSGKDVVALNGASLALAARTTMALIGESGSGKSTLALCISGMERPTSGRIWLDGSEITAMKDHQLRTVRPQVQLVFQDPAASLNPRWTAAQIVSEPLRVQERLGKAECRERACVLLEQVGLSTKKVDQRPEQFSGGQRQRLALARALALRPKLLIMDEAASGLDCSVQAQIVNLLAEVQASFHLAYLFITHDFALAACIADSIAVMEQGRIVETGTATELAHRPQHSATRRLVAAAKESQTRFHQLQAV